MRIPRYNKYMSVLFHLVALATFFACASKEVAPVSASPSVAKEQIKEPVREEKFAHSPYLSNTHTNIYIKNRSIIEQFGRRLGITSSFIIGIISDVHLSLSDNGYAMVINAENTPFFQKKQVMKNIDAIQIDGEGRYWKQEQDGAMPNYFDITYRNLIIISTIDLSVHTDIWGWEVPQALAHYAENNQVHAWMWSKADAMVEAYKKDDFSIHWGAMVITSYPNKADEDMVSSMIFDYRGNKSMRTTIKLLVPFLLESMGGVDELSSLPNVYFDHEQLFLEHIRLNKQSFWKYFANS